MSLYWWYHVLWTRLLCRLTRHQDRVKVYSAYRVTWCRRCFRSKLVRVEVAR